MNTPEFLTVEEAAQILRVNVKTIYDAIRTGEMPGVLRLGRVIRIRRSDLGLPALTPEAPDRQVDAAGPGSSSLTRISK